MVNSQNQQFLSKELITKWNCFVEKCGALIYGLILSLATLKWILLRELFKGKVNLELIQKFIKNVMENFHLSFVGPVRERPIWGSGRGREVPKEREENHFRA